MPGVNGCLERGPATDIQLISITCYRRRRRRRRRRRNVVTARYYNQ